MAGQYYDDESGLHYNWHRYYDPVTGRYLTPDPIGLDGGINLYAYVQNNPVNLIDPTGEIAVTGTVIAIWAGIEIGLSIYDIWETSTTIADPCSSNLDKGIAVGGLALGAILPGGGYSKGSKMALSEAKMLLKRWDKSTYDKLSDSIRDHARRHGFGNDVATYMRKAASFKKKGARTVNRSDGTILFRKKSGEYLIERNGKIVSYGLE